MTILPLKNQWILITRPPEQAAVFCDALQAHGAQVVCCPMISIEILPPPPALDALLTHATSPDWLVFTSVNGVRAFAERALTLKVDLPQHFAQSQIASVGPRTAEALEQLGLQVDCFPANHTAEALAELLITPNLRHKQLTLIQAEQAQPLLAERLKAQAKAVQQMSVYRSRPGRSATELNVLLNSQRFDWLTFLNSLSIQHFESALTEQSRQGLRQSKIACIGPVTARQAQQSLGRCDLMATPHTVAGLVQSLCQEAA